MQEIKQEKSPIKQRILQYLGEKGISMYDCYAKTGITRGILGQNNGISEDNLARFLAYYKEVNIAWLVSGEGSMLCDNKNPELVVTGDVPNAIPISPAQESIIYNMYKDEKAEKERMLKEKDVKIDQLQTELREKSEELAALKAHVEYSQHQDKEPGWKVKAVTEDFTSPLSGDYGEDSVPMRKPTTSGISSGERM